MLNGLRKDGITDVWVQSAYRSVKEQEKVYNDKVRFYQNQGKTLVFLAQKDRVIGLVSIFDDIKEILLDEFTPKQPLLPENQELFNRIHQTESVCVSVRCSPTTAAKASSDALSSP